MKEPVKVGFCIAYDWYLLAYSLPLVYDAADQICLSIDRDRISWSGQRYDFNDAAFRELVASIDLAGKVSILEEDYHLPDLSPMANEVRQRNRIGAFLGAGGWHVQLDCDEYFLDFNGFVRYLRAFPQGKRPLNICCPWVVLYKQVNTGFLFVDPITRGNIEYMQIATRHPVYEYGRRNGFFNVYTNFAIIHQSWARDREEIRAKISNWGHARDFDTERYFSFWDSLNENTYTTASDFHFLKPPVWPRLNFVAADSVHVFVEKFKAVKFPKLSRFDLLMRNSLFVSRLKRLMKMI